MNPSENEFREVLRRREPPEGFAERVMSKAGHARSVPASPVRSRLATPLMVIAAAVLVVGIAGFLMTNCVSACSIGGPVARVANDLVPPVAPVGGANVVPPGGGHFRGPEKAEIVLEEFGDYECPACGYYYPIVEDVLRRFPRVRFEFHHYPLIAMHPNAMAAAIAAEAAGEQNRFWEMHSMLYQQQKEWAHSNSENAQAAFTAYAGQIGLDMAQFKKSLSSYGVMQRVADDLQRGKDAKVQGTPEFFINGQAIPLPRTADEFDTLIHKAAFQLRGDSVGTTRR